MKKTLKKIYEWLYRLLSPKHKIGFHGSVLLVGRDKDICAECGKRVKLQ